MRIGVVLCVAVSACGSVQAEQPDAPPEIDAMPDAPSAVHYRFVVDGYRIPSTSPEATTYGLDLDGDTDVDNKIGRALATFTSMGIDTKPATKAAVDRGTSITLVEYSTPDLVDATGAGAAIFTGLTPTPMPCTGPTDAVCRHHLDGTGTFAAATAPVNPPLVGDVATGVFLGGPGQVAMDLVMPGGGLARFSLIGAKIRVTEASDVGATLIIAGAATSDEVTSEIYPAIRLEAMTAMTRDCANTMPPGCGCVAGSIGASYASLFDTTPKNCTISPEEISGHALLGSLFAPDVMVGNVMATSFGVGATAVKATFTPP